MPSRVSRVIRAVASLAWSLGAAALLAPSAAAQEAPPPSPGAPVRLFKSFIQDGAIQPHVWLEGQWRLENNAPLIDGNDGTLNYLSGILALGFDNRVEAGLSWGGVNVDPDGASSHSGTADLEVYGKYLVRDAPLNVAVGGLVKIPTADSQKQLGSGSADWEAFAALRRDFGHIQAIGNAGLRWNGDPDAVDVSGNTSVLAGGGVIFELGRSSFGSLELNFESRRYEGLHSDFRLTPGLMARLGERGFLRAAVGIGLSDGAPDTEFLFGLGWAY
jgi:hypothetical protein